MKTRPSFVIGIAVLALGSIAILPVLGMCLLGLVTLLLPALVVLAPVLLVTPVWWLLASNRDRSAPAGVTTGAGAASLTPVLQRSVR